MLYSAAMSATKKPVRKSVTVSPSVAGRIRSLAKAQRTSENRVLVHLIETGLEAKEQEKQHYLALLERLRETTKPSDQERIMDELARMTFGD